MPNEVNKHIEDLAQAYIIENDLDAKEWHAVEETHEFDVKANSDDDRDGIKIAGYLSTFKNVDRQNDIVGEDAFNDTIKGLKRLPMLKDHMNQTDFQIGSWTKFKIDEVGLYVEGFISKTKETEHLITMIKDGHLNTLSMGGLFKYSESQNRKGNNIIEKVHLLEGSVVSIPANPKAQFAMKSLSKVDQVAQAKEKQVDDAKHKQLEALKLLYGGKI